MSSKCFEVMVPECPSEMLIKAGLEAEKTYYVDLVDKFGQRYNQQCSSDSNGNILVKTSALPDGSLNRYSGNWVIEARKSNSNCEPELFQFCCEGEVKTFPCIIVSFIQSTLGSLPTDIGCVCNDLINPTPPTEDGNAPVEFPFENATSVECNHNFGRYVDVTIYDSERNEIYGQVIQENLNKVVVSFNQPLTGIILID